jgi:hypothetical protein
MKAVLNARISNTNVTVNKHGESLTTTSPVVLKNQVTELRSIEDIADVSEVDVVAGATIVYNSVNDKYEVRQLTAAEVNITNLGLDGGEF